jgi:hypothetical protein
MTLNRLHNTREKRKGKENKYRKGRKEKEFVKERKEKQD